MQWKRSLFVSLSSSVSAKKFKNYPAELGEIQFSTYILIYIAAQAYHNMILDNIHYTLYSIVHTVYTIHYTAYLHNTHIGYSHYTVYSIQYTLYSIC